MKKTIKQWFEEFPQPYRDMALNDMIKEQANKECPTIIGAIIFGCKHNAIQAQLKQAYNRGKLYVLEGEPRSDAPMPELAGIWGMIFTEYDSTRTYSHMTPEYRKTDDTEFESDYQR